MKPLSLIVRLIVIAVSGYALISVQADSKYETFVFDDLIFSILLFFTMLIYMTMAIYDISKYIKTKKAIYFLPITIGIVLLLFIAKMTYNQNEELVKPSFLKAYYDGDYNGIALDFKEDWTYIYDSYCLGSHYFYGTYMLTDSTIICSEGQSKNETIGPFQLIFKQTNEYDTFDEKGYLHEISGSDHPKSTFIYRITTESDDFLKWKNQAN